MDPQNQRESFGSRLGFILVSAGCAIGIGNVWRFPTVTGQYGGGIFVLFYLLFLVLMGLPVLTMELAVGRAGRGSKQGRAIIQTFTPENEVIRAAAAQDYDAFYESEIRMRRLRRYPPFADLFSFTVTGSDESRVIRAAKALRDALGYAVERREELKPLSIEVLGPAGASVVKVNNRYRYRVFLVGKGCPALRRLVAEYLYAFYQHKENRGLDIFADCNAIQ